MKGKKYALVTGASRGIGRAISIKLAKEGYGVLINYSSNHDAARETLNLIEKEGGTGELVQFQVENFDESGKVIEKWLKHHPDDKIAVLVNNAGITRDNLLAFMEEKQFDEVVDVSLKGTFNVTRHLIRHMVKNKDGRIINVASLSGLKGVPGQFNYSAAKGGVIAATKALAQEVAKKNITVNAVVPGFISTEMTKEMETPEVMKMIPVRRFGTANEVAELVSFLASDHSGYITGEAININGGLYS